MGLGLAVAEAATEGDCDGPGCAAVELMPHADTAMNPISAALCSQCMAAD
jgi:hypothetical protein